MSEARLIEIAREYRDSANRCEALRTSEPYPFKDWKAEWDRRIDLQSQLLKVARGLPSSL